MSGTVLYNQPVAFTLGGKPAGKLFASCKRVTVFSRETQYIMLLLFVILRDDDDKEGRIGTNGMGHYTEKRNDVGEFCTLVRELYRYDHGLFEYSPSMSEFHKRSLRTLAYIILSILNYNIEPNHDKVPTEPVDRFRKPISSDLFLSSLRSHWPARQRHVNNQNKSAGWTRACLASGFPPGNRSRRDLARYRSGITQK